MFESFCDWDLKDTGSRDEPGAGAPLVQSKGDHSREFDGRCKTKHTQREGLYVLRIRCRGVGHPLPLGKDLILEISTSRRDLVTEIPTPSLPVSPPPVFGGKVIFSVMFVCLSVWTQWGFPCGRYGMFTIDVYLCICINVKRHEWVQTHSGHLCLHFH